MAWDDAPSNLRQSGITGGGVGWRAKRAQIAGITDIARHPTPESQDRAFRGPRSSPRSERPEPHQLTTKDTHSTPLSQAQGRSGQAAERKGDSRGNLVIARDRKSKASPRMTMMGDGEA